MQLFNAETKRDTIKALQKMCAKSIRTVSCADWEGYVIPTANAIFSAVYTTEDDTSTRHDTAIAAIGVDTSEESLITTIFMASAIIMQYPQYTEKFRPYALHMFTRLPEDNLMRVWMNKIMPLSFSNDDLGAVYAEPPDYCPDPERLQYVSDHLRAIISVTKNASKANLKFLVTDVVSVVTSYWLEARNISVSAAYAPESCADILRKHGANDRLIDAVTEYIDSCKDLGTSNDPA